MSVIFGTSGQGLLFDLRFGMAMAIFSLLFTIPGALMLVGLNARLVDAGWSQAAASLFVFIVGSVAGAIILAFGVASIANAAMGAAFGATTALALIVLTALKRRAAT